jgi:hypothetical protein
MTINLTTGNISANHFTLESTSLLLDSESASFTFDLSKNESG